MFNEFKVGVLAIASLLAIGYMSFMITSKQAGYGRYTKYRTIIRDASGVFPKTPIKVAGITAGRINNIELLDNNALITFEIIDKIKLTKGSKLRIKSVGFLGDRYIEILLNGDETEPIPEMGFLSASEGGGMENLMRDAGDIMAEVKELVVGFKKALVPENEQSPLKLIANNLSETTKNLSTLVKSLSTIVTGNEGKINNLITNLNGLTEQLNAEFDDRDEASAMSEFKDTLANIQSMSMDLKDVMSDIKKGKGTIGKFLVEDKIADDIKTTLASVKKMVGKASTLRSEFNAFTGTNRLIGAKTDIGLNIFPSPERFYLIGLTVSDFGKETQRESTVLNGSGTVISNTTTKDKSKSGFLINAQFGRRIHDWTFRIGVIESTGGLGIDYNFNSIGNKLSFDFYDYRKSIGINWRISNELRLWNVVYGKVSLEDSLATSSGTISAGLKFNEEDLKSLLGFFF